MVYTQEDETRTAVGEVAEPFSLNDEYCLSVQWLPLSGHDALDISCGGPHLIAQGYLHLLFGGEGVNICFPDPDSSEDLKLEVLAQHSLD